MHAPLDPNTVHLLDYYVAFEAILASGRTTRNDLRTHFGLLEELELDDDYCFFAAIARPQEHREHIALVARGMDRLHDRVFGSLDPRRPLRALDVGFGAGGTLRQLATTLPEAELVGININPEQLAVAQRELGDEPRIELVHGDFLNHRFAPEFDLVYLIESAFHMPDKLRVCERIAAALQPGGAAYIVDIFVSEAAARRIGQASVGAPREGIFDYRDLDSWRRMLGNCGLAVTEFDDLTEAVARHIRIRTPRAEARVQLFEPVVAGRPRTDSLLRCLDQAYVGYRRLGRLFDRGVLRYGILRAIKHEVEG